MGTRRGNRGAARLGQALVEFALVATIALTLIIGVIQLGFVIYAGAVLTGAVQDGAARAARDGATLEDGRQRTIDLLEAGRIGHLGRWTVAAEDLGEAVRVSASGELPFVVPLGGRRLHLAQGHTAGKERFRP